MNSRNDTGVVAGPASGRTSHPRRLRGLAGTSHPGAEPPRPDRLTIAEALATHKRKEPPC